MKVGELILILGRFNPDANVRETILTSIPEFVEVYEACVDGKDERYRWMWNGIDLCLCGINCLEHYNDATAHRLEKRFRKVVI